MCIYWAGKEAIFKLNGKQGLNFKNDIRISNFMMKQKDVIRSEFTREESPVRIALNYEDFDSHIICYCF